MIKKVIEDFIEKITDSTTIGIKEWFAPQISEQCP